MAKPFAPQLHEGANRVRSPLRFPKYPNQKKTDILVQRANGSTTNSLLF